MLTDRALTRSLLRVMAVDPGYRVDGALVRDLTLPVSPATEEARRRHAASNNSHRFVAAATRD